MLTTLGVLDLPGGLRTSEDWRRWATRRLGGKCLLEWLVRRMTDAQRLDGVILLLPADSPLADLAALCPPDVPVYLAAAVDHLGQFAEVVAEYPTRSVVRVRLDSPMIDGVLLDRLARDGEFGGDLHYCYCGVADEIEGPRTPLVEWFTASAIRKADQLAKDPASRDDATRFLRDHPELFAWRQLDPPSALAEGAPFEVQSQEDWESLLEAIEALDASDCDSEEVARMLVRRPKFLESRAPV